MADKKKEVNSDELTELIVDGILEKKGENIAIVNLKEVEGAITDYFVICEGKSSTQIDAIKESIEEVVRKATGEKPWHIEGTQNLEWVLVDYVNVVAHIFNRERREFYNLEGLWADAEINEIAAEQ
jgi:ribosome-associated protein